MNTTICDAIKSRRVLRFSYNGGDRTVAPFAYGSGRQGQGLLRAHFQ
jgi:hypothetical protein